MSHTASSKFSIRDNAQIVLEMENVGIWEYDIEHQEVSICNISQTLLNTNSSTHTLDSFIHMISNPEESDCIRGSFEKAVSEQTGLNITIDAALAGKPGFYTSIKGKPKINSDGTAIIIGSIRQTKKHHKISNHFESGKKPGLIEEELEEEKQLLNSIVSNLPTLFFLFDENGKFFRWNENLEKVTKYSSEEVLDMHPVQFFDEDQVDPITNAILEVFTKGTTTVESELLTKTGKKIPYFFFAAQIQYRGKPCLVGYGIDITARKKAEDKLRVSEKRFKSLVQDGGDLIAILDKDSNYQYISPTAERILGLQADKQIHKNSLTYVHYEDQQRLYDALKNLPQNKQIQLDPYRYMDANGNWRWLETVLTNLTDEPAVGGYVANSRDITDKKELEQTIYKEKKLLDEIISNIPMIFFIFNAEGKPLRWNDELLNITGYTEEEAENMSPLEYFDDDQLPKVIEIIQHTFTKGSATIETEILTKDGRKIPHFFFGAKIQYNNEDCLVGYGVDITDQKEAELKILESEKRFKSLVQDGQDLLAIIDNEGNYKYVSPSSLSVLGYPPEFFEGKNAFEFIPENDKARLQPALQSLQPGERVTVGPYRFADSNGNWRWLETVLTNLENEPSISGLVANTKDVTKLKEHEDKLKASLEEKEVLLAEIHHRVKNNLAVVSGMMQMQALEEENSEIEEKLLDSVFRIQAMANIHEILYQSSSFSQLTYSDIVHRLMNGIKDALQGNRDITIEFDSPEFEMNVNQAIPFSLILNEVVTNIYKHAFKEIREGIIKVTTKHSGDQITVHISDNGVGLPDNFDMDTSKSLGMSIINILARQLEAEHFITSDKNGTTFTISFKQMNIRGSGSGIISDDNYS
ncbi:MAG: PAS domain S-box protein [Balneolaceae bacterium]|nr:PAS domain S-box protein [Balneolaceae bacterium]